MKRNNKADARQEAMSEARRKNKADEREGAAMSETRRKNKADERETRLPRDKAQTGAAAEQGGAPSVLDNINSARALWAENIETPAGEVQACAGEKYLYFLFFADKMTIALKNALARAAAQGRLKQGENKILAQLKQELTAYFAGESAAFTVPLAPCGTIFQQKAWAALRQALPGQTHSYLEQAGLMGLPPRYGRAVGHAIAKNPFLLLLPCHRIIAAGGGISGYNGGVERKKMLLAHEKRCFSGSQA